MSLNRTLDATLLRERLDYEPTTGVFTHRRLNARRKPGEQAGYVTPQGYRSINVDHQRHLAHRLAWLHVHGELPSGHLDHINGDRQDNRLANLRLVSNVGNAQNSHSARVDSNSGLKGVSQHARGHWFARITVNGERIFLGSFATPEEAHEAYVQAKRKLHPWWVEQAS